ncbi:Gfo/Idh/MocA family protein [Luteolibacter sp. Populi]|uniref:Gfo/Idh/MocA family protein n=1 Tax=Luteolibacter sp. Populi TaxID=3230487 RepID=UPI003466EA74
MKRSYIRAFCAALLVSSGSAEEGGRAIRIGIIGLDTGHSTEFTRIINMDAGKPEYAAKLKGLKVVAAYPAGSKDIPESVNRVPGYTEEIRKMGVEIVGSVDELVTKVDAVLLESNDGKVHLEQIRPVLKAKKPVFVDKPVAASLADCIRIFNEAEAAGTPLFSSSALRFGKATQQVREGKIGKVSHVEAHSPAHLEKSHPDLFWYGIHGVEPLFTVLGKGAIRVKRTKTADGLIEVSGEWSGGRRGIFRESNQTDRKGYGGAAKGESGELAMGSFDGYEPLVLAVADFFRTGKPPVSAEETLEIYAFMEAADESKRRGGEVVTLQETMDKAKAKIAR